MSILLRVAIGLLGVLLLAYAGLTAVIYANQGKLLFAAGHGRLNVAAAGVPGMHAVTLPTSDGLALTAWYKAALPERPVLLVFHGNAGDLTGYTALMALLDQTGWGLLFVEYRGYGSNPGTPSEKGFTKDALAAYEFIRAQNIAPDRIMLYGQSLGTGVAVRLATEKPVAAVILDAPYTSIAAVAQLYYWYLPAELLVTNRFNILSRIQKIHAPLLVMQGAQDQVIPPIMGQRVYAAAVEPKQFWSSPVAGHGNVLWSGGYAVMLAFVKRYVPGG